jgi:hypothetical protein
MDIRDCQVGNAEIDLAVGWIGGPGGGLRQGKGSREGQNAGDKRQTLHKEDSFRCRAPGPMLDRFRAWRLEPFVRANGETRFTRRQSCRVDWTRQGIYLLQQIFLKMNINLVPASGVARAKGWL